MMGTGGLGRGMMCVDREIYLKDVIQASLSKFPILTTKYSTLGSGADKVEPSS